MYKPLIILIFILSAISNALPQAKIESISFRGNSFFSSNELLNSMVLRKEKDFDSVQFRYDRVSIREKYKSAGFLYARIDSSSIDYNSDSSLVSLAVYVNEGGRVTVGEIEITGNSVLTKEQVLRHFETGEGDVLSENTLNNDIKSLLEYYESRGMPFAKAEIKDISIYEAAGKDRLRVTIDINENSFVSIDEVKIRGNTDTEDYVITRELKLDKSKPVTVESLQEMKLRLEKLNIFERVEDPKIYRIKNRDRSGLLVEVKEGNTNTFDGIIGYIPPAADDEKGYFTGLINLSFRNLFGTGRRIEAKWEQEVRETQELEFRYFEPYLLSLPFNVYGGFLQRIQDSTYTRRRLDFKADYTFSNKFTIAALGGYERVIPADAENLVFRIADSRTLTSGVELRYDNRDNVYIPVSGGLYRTSYSYGSKKIFNLDELQQLGYRADYSIQRYTAEADVYLSFFKRQSNLVKVFAGEVRSDKLEDSDFFRVGGNRSIRGYREEQFLASRVAYSNIELRYALSRRSFVFGFYDFGYIFRPEDSLNSFPEQSEFLYGYGIGLRMETALGLIGVSYALGKGDTFLDGKIHFGLVNDF
jgi:outer membrane protein insertion porin family